MRTFTRLRHMISDNEDLKRELAELREQTDERFQIVFETLDQIAAFFEVDVRTIERYLEKYGDELGLNGYEVLRGKRLVQIE